MRSAKEAGESHFSVRKKGGEKLLNAIWLGKGGKGRGLRAWARYTKKMLTFTGEKKKGASPIGRKRGELRRFIFRPAAGREGNPSIAHPILESMFRS